VSFPVYLIAQSCDCTQSLQLGVNNKEYLRRTCVLRDNGAKNINNVYVLAILPGWSNHWFHVLDILSWMSVTIGQFIMVLVTWLVTASLRRLSCRGYLLLFSFASWSSSSGCRVLTAIYLLSCTGTLRPGCLVRTVRYRHRCLLTVLYWLSCTVNLTHLLINSTYIH
jgi:hypothetical protein